MNRNILVQRSNGMNCTLTNFTIQKEIKCNNCFETFYVLQVKVNNTKCHFFLFSICKNPIRYKLFNSLFLFFFLQENFYGQNTFSHTYFNHYYIISINFSQRFLMHNLTKTSCGIQDSIFFFFNVYFVDDESKTFYLLFQLKKYLRPVFKCKPNMKFKKNK